MRITLQARSFLGFGKDPRASAGRSVRRRTDNAAQLGQHACMKHSSVKFTKPVFYSPAPEREIEFPGEDEEAFTNEGAPPPVAVEAQSREPVRVSYILAPMRSPTRSILSLDPESLVRRKMRHRHRPIV